MKPIWMFLLLIISLTSYSQIEVRKPLEKITIGKVNSSGSLLAELYYRVIDGDTIYTIMYNNYEYKHITDYQVLSFSPDGGTLAALYSLMKSVFSDENKKNKDYKVEVKLGKTDVVLSNFRSMGATQLMFYTSKGWFLINEKQVDKLFGK